MINHLQWIKQMKEFINKQKVKKKHMRMENVLNDKSNNNRDVQSFIFLCVLIANKIVRTHSHFSQIRF